jgi:hypothetical protein
VLWLQGEYPDNGRPAIVAPGAISAAGLIVLRGIAQKGNFDMAGPLAGISDIDTVAEQKVLSQYGQTMLSVQEGE